MTRGSPRLCPAGATSGEGLSPVGGNADLPRRLVAPDTDVMALLEREAPLAALAEYAGHARKGAGLLVLVSGEAGVGKSALLDELAVGLGGESWYWGACDGL